MRRARTHELQLPCSRALMQKYTLDSCPKAISQLPSKGHVRGFLSLRADDGASLAAVLVCASLRRLWEYLRRSIQASAYGALAVCACACRSSATVPHGGKPRQTGGCWVGGGAVGDGHTTWECTGDRRAVICVKGGSPTSFRQKTPEPPPSRAPGAQGACGGDADRAG